MTKNKATVYAYVGHNRGVATDYEGNRKRNGWIKLNLELDIDECVEKLSWRSTGYPVRDNPVEVAVDSWGSNNIVLRKQDLDELVGTILTMCDAMIAEKDQKDAWKHLLRSTIHKWHDGKMYRYNLELDDKSDKSRVEVE